MDVISQSALLLFFRTDEGGSYPGQDQEEEPSRGKRNRKHKKRKSDGECVGTENECLCCKTQRFDVCFLCVDAETTPPPLFDVPQVW